MSRLTREQFFLLVGAVIFLAGSFLPVHSKFDLSSGAPTMFTLQGASLAGSSLWLLLIVLIIFGGYIGSSFSDDGEGMLIIPLVAITIPLVNFAIGGDASYVKTFGLSAMGIGTFLMFSGLAIWFVIGILNAFVPKASSDAA